MLREGVAMREAETGRASPMGYRGVNCTGRVLCRGGGVGCRNCRPDRSPVSGWDAGVFLAARRITLLQHAGLGGVQEKEWAGRYQAWEGEWSDRVRQLCSVSPGSTCAWCFLVCAPLSRLHQRERCGSRLAGCGRHRAGRALELRQE